MSRQELSRESILKTLIHRYYSLRPLEEPPYIHMREVALESLEDRKYIRHLGFPSMTHLYNYILNTKTPLHLYYSSAYYESPTIDKMELKGWQGSDLLFDIDSDHYPGCSNVLSFCISENKFFSEKIKKCPDSGEKPIIYPIITIDCINRAFKDAYKLYTILHDEFSFRDIKIYFSGNRGFHVKVFDDEVKGLTGDERREIASYISMENIKYEKLFPIIGKREKYVLLINNREYGIRRRVLEYIIRNKLVENISSQIIKIAYDTLMNILDDLRINIDIVVTMDVSRLSRFNRSINGKSGLIVRDIGKVNEEFVFAYEDYCPWKGYVTVKPLIDFTGLPIYNDKINLHRGEKITLDACKAIYLFFKGLVSIVNMDKVVVENV
jgi:DNA primase small subunit